MNTATAQTFAERRRQAQRMHWLQIGSAALLGLGAAWISTTVHADEANNAQIALASPQSRQALASQSAAVDRLRTADAEWETALRQALLASTSTHTAARSHNERR